MLARRVAGFAAGLRRLGVGRGDRVAALLPNIPEKFIVDPELKNLIPLLQLGGKGGGQ